MGRRTPVMNGTLVLDSDGLAKLAAGDQTAIGHLRNAHARRSRVIVSSITLTEVLRGGRRDALVHRVLNGCVTVPVSEDLGRGAGELLGRTGLDGHRCAIDAVVAATALAQPGPVYLLTSDPKDLETLTEQPGAPRHEQVTVLRV